LTSETDAPREEARQNDQNRRLSKWLGCRLLSKTHNLTLDENLRLAWRFGTRRGALKVATDVCVLRQGASVFSGNKQSLSEQGRAGDLSSMYL
jgi:hypothetical protein